MNLITLKSMLLMLSMSKSIIAAGIGLAIAGLLTGRGQAQPRWDANDDETRKVRLEFMKNLRSEFEMSRDGPSDQSLNAVDEPILRFTNPIRSFFSDGALFVWLDRNRPVAIASIAIRGTGGVWLETASLSAGTLKCLRKNREYWTPESATLAEQRLTDAPVPATSPPVRLTQMRRLCEQFELRTEPAGEQPVPLRLMPQPLYRFEDGAADVLDGALFTFTEGTDPEAVLLLEAVRAGSREPAFWRFTIARMTSRPVVAKRNDAVVWSVPGYWGGPRSSKDGYQERQLTLYPPPIK